MKFRASAQHIDRHAEEERQRSRPMSAGQMMTYLAKIEQARAFKANPKLPKSDMPHLLAEAEAKNVSVDQVATAIIREYRKWAARDAQIETKRLQRKSSNEA